MLDIDRLLQAKVRKQDGQVLEYSFQVSHPEIPNIMI